MKGALKSIPMWLWVSTVFLILGVIGLILPQESKQTQASEPDTIPTQPRFMLTQSELAKFDNKLVEIDPDQRLINSVTQWKDSVLVNVSVTQEFMELPRAERGEMAITLRDELATVCECAPYLYLNNESGEHVVEIGVGLPKYRL
ncbi:hypothetical protein N836_05550 [Leptolyngbya sp. Heron Island J]|uniref:hypothetical protein n=1 Tax=Leptolyngbya sp. Heron Island J TaxID=1385935 RepID=UPI0003B94588|nr:hypothetical protein [Leptolyngbya sp. Heron Island J]ESA37028.1 hypothetical protein N836_05550 [Leptolyngbya sp. Heron Island J]